MTRDQTMASTKPPNNSLPDDERLMAGLVRLWRATRHTNEQDREKAAILELWMDHLEAYPIQETERVLRRLTSSEVWWPSLADFERAYREEFQSCLL